MTKPLCALAFLVVAACVATPDDLDEPRRTDVGDPDVVEVDEATARGEIHCVAWPCCGDGVCDGGETHDTCRRDCPIVCITWPCCGDNSCDGGETAWSCPDDCAPAPVTASDDWEAP